MNLFPELLSEIANHVDHIVAFALVCHQWHKVAMPYIKIAYTKYIIKIFDLSNGDILDIFDINKIINKIHINQDFYIPGITYYPKHINYNLDKIYQYLC